MPPKKRALVESSSAGNIAPPAKKRGTKIEPGPSHDGTDIKTIIDIFNPDIAHNPGTYTALFAKDIKLTPVFGRPGNKPLKEDVHPADKIKLENQEHPQALTEYVCIGHGDPKEAPKRKAKQVLMKPASEFPSWKWIFTRAALWLQEIWMLGDEKRNQDELGCYFYNDFTGYGQHENIENMVQAAYLEYTNKPFDIDRYWTHVQAIGLYFHESDLMPWNTIETDEEVGTMLPLIGAVILAGLNKLDRAELLGPDSRIRNIALICSLYLQFAHMEAVGSFADKLKVWPARIIEYCNHFGIELSDKTGVIGTERFVARFEKKSIKYEKFKKAAEDRWGLTTAYNTYHKEHYTSFSFCRKWRRIGGSRYDITKMTKEDRIKSSYEGNDPLEGMGTPRSDG